MDDYMDSLVKEVEGSIRPIRSERMDDFDQPAYTAPQMMPQQRAVPPVNSVPPVYTMPPVNPMPTVSPVPAPQPAPRMIPQPQAMPQIPQPQVPQQQMISPQVPPQQIPAPQPSVAPAAENPSAGTSSAAGGDGTEKLERDLFLHIHRENVKCYRNTQATIIENTNLIKQSEEENHSNVHSWLVGLLILSIINLGASALMILHMIFGFI